MYELGNGPEMNPLNRERVAYDSAKMPLYIREGQLRDYPNLAYVCHWHEDLEFLCVMEGHMSYFVNGARYLLREGEGIFVNARQLHYGYSGDKTNSRFSASCSTRCSCAPPHGWSTVLSARSLPMGISPPWR